MKDLRQLRKWRRILERVQRGFRFLVDGEGRAGREGSKGGSTEVRQRRVSEEPTRSDVGKEI